MISGLAFIFIQCLVIVFNRVDQPGAETITKCSCNGITEFLGLEVKTDMWLARVKNSKQ